MWRQIAANRLIWRPEHAQVGELTIKLTYFLTLSPREQAVFLEEHSGVAKAVGRDCTEMGHC